MHRIDGYLSGKAQTVYPSALVIELESGAWILRRSGEPDLLVGAYFREAKMAVAALVKCERVRRAEILEERP